MMNKKAIAAFAAGATLLAGFAMATPAFAKDEAPKCTPAAQADIDAAAAKVASANATVASKKAALSAAKVKYNNAGAQLETVKGLDKAKKAAEDHKTDVTVTNKDKYSKEQQDKATKDAEDAAKALTDGLAAAAKSLGKDSFADVAAVKAEVTNLRNAVSDAEDELNDAKEAAKNAEAELAKAQCKDAPKTDPDHKDPTPTPAPTGSKAEHVAKLYGLKSVLDDAEGNMNGKLKTYHELFAKLSAAKAEMDAAKANLDAADQAVKDALAAGLNTSNPSAYKDLTERAARALAHYLAAQKTYNEVKAEFDKAYAEAVNASAAYNKALEAYKKAINAALADGVKLPGDLPVLTDPLAELNLPVPAGVPTPTVPGQPGQPGKPGKPGKPEVEKKKDDGKKLPKTGVGVTLTALAATMLAGMGAAVRKARH